MSILNNYPRYTVRAKVKANMEGLTPEYILALRTRLLGTWSGHREEIARKLATGDLSELRHWLQALVEAIYDIANGMVPVETDLPGLKDVVDEYGQNVRLLYTALFVLSCWELGLTSSSSEGALAREAQMAGIGSRALLELMRRVEPLRETIYGAREPFSVDVGRREEPSAQTIVVRPMNTRAGRVDGKAELASALRERFRQVEREVLLRRLDIDPEDVKLNPFTRDDFVWAMIVYAEQRARLADLWDAVVQERPGCISPPNPFSAACDERGSYR